MENQSWSIIILCFNEVDTIKKVVDQSRSVMQKMQIHDWEIIIVDDGSTDGSKEMIKSLKLDHLTCIFHKKNKGIGQTLHSGYNSSTKENICAIPADGEFDVTELTPYSRVEENQFISFYRIENTSYSIARNYLSKLNKSLNKLLNGFDLLDVNWVKIYKRSDIQQLDLVIKSSLIESEICGKLLSLDRDVVEVESKYLHREFGISKGVSFKIITQAIRDILLLSITLKKFKMSVKD